MDKVLVKGSIAPKRSPKLGKPKRARGRRTLDFESWADDEDGQRGEGLTPLVMTGIGSRLGIGPKGDPEVSALAQSNSTFR